MARSLPKVCPFLVTVDLKLKWPELPRGPNYPALPYRDSQPSFLSPTSLTVLLPELFKCFPNRVGVLSSNK